MHPSREAVRLGKDWVDLDWLRSELGTRETISLLRYLEMNKGIYACGQVRIITKKWRASAKRQEVRDSYRRLIDGVFHGSR